MNIYVGNLARTVTEEQLNDLFSAHGTVKSAKVIKDKFSGEPRGFAFVEMSTDDEGKAAVEALNGADVDGRNMKVMEARPRDNTRRPRFGGNGGGGNGGGGSSYGGGGGGSFGGNNRY